MLAQSGLAAEYVLIDKLNALTLAPSVSRVLLTSHSVGIDWWLLVGRNIRFAFVLRVRVLFALDS